MEILLVNEKENFFETMLKIVCLGAEETAQ